MRRRLRLLPATCETLEPVRGGHRLEVAATRRYFRSMFSRGCTHLECPRQEEQAQLPQGYGSDVLFSTSAPPTAAKVSGCPTLDSVTVMYRSLETACQEGCESFRPPEALFRGTDAGASLMRNSASRRGIPVPEPRKPWIVERLLRSLERLERRGDVLGMKLGSGPKLEVTKV